LPGLSGLNGTLGRKLIHVVHHSDHRSQVGALPTWPHSANWGYGPGGIVGVLLIIVLVLALMGRL
jgi:Protein of unknown function (DUF3309)